MPLTGQVKQAFDAALLRLKTYYDGQRSYDPVDNPGGFRRGGNVVNFVPSLQDVADVGAGIGTLADEVSQASTYVGQQRGLAESAATQAKQSADQANATVAQKADAVELPDLELRRAAPSVALDGSTDVSTPVSSALSTANRPLLFPTGRYRLDADAIPWGGRFAGFSPEALFYSGSVEALTVAQEQVLPGVICKDSFTRWDRMRCAKQHPTIATFGDSITAWVASEIPGPSGRIGAGQGSYPAYLDAMMNEYVFYSEGRVRGDGNPGLNSQELRDKLDATMSVINPNIIVYFVGANDANDRRARDAVMADMAYSLEYFIQRSVMPVVVGVPFQADPNDTVGDKIKRIHGYNASLKRMCDRYGIPFISTIALTQSVQATYLVADGVHYTDAFNFALAGLVRDAIVHNYGLPQDRFHVHKVSRGDGVDTWSWDLPGLFHSSGTDLIVAQTPDQYVRRMYPYCLKISPGQTVAFKADGPGGLLIDSMSPGTMQVNGVDTVLLGRQTAQFIGSVSARLNGSSSTFTVGAKAGTDFVHVVGTLNMHASSPHDYRTASTTAIRNGLYVPNKVMTIGDGTSRMHTIMRPLAIGGTVDAGVDPSTGIQNVGSTSARTALSAAFLPPGQRYFDTDTMSFWRWNGSTQAWVAA